MIRSITLPVERSGPNHIPRRDLVVKGGDSLTFNLRIVDADRPDALPLDLSGIGPQVLVRIWRAVPRWDYGCLIRGERLAEAAGAPTSAADGQTVVTFDRGDAVCEGGRYGWSVHLDCAGDVTTLCWGVLNVFPGGAVTRAEDELLDSNGEVLILDSLQPVVV
jgi:hypothetical protein